MPQAALYRYRYCTDIIYCTIYYLYQYSIIYHVTSVQIDPFATNFMLYRTEIKPETR